MTRRKQIEKKTTTTKTGCHNRQIYKMKKVSVSTCLTAVILVDLNLLTRNLFLSQVIIPFPRYLAGLILTIYIAEKLACHQAEHNIKYGFKVNVRSSYMKGKTTDVK